MDVVVAGGVESISLVQTAEMRLDIDPSVTAHAKHAYMPMIETADHVADKYEVNKLNAGDFIETSETDGVHFEPEAHKLLGKTVANYILEQLL